MVGLPASGPKSACNPGRVATPPLLYRTSWQSGETPCGRSAGDMSVTRPPKISMGASKEPAVVIANQRKERDWPRKNRGPGEERKPLPLSAPSGGTGLACQALRVALQPQ